jgi:CCR4-NOT transcription complex subunit 3
MEQFKICEKDTKTKSFSKDGKDSRFDPKEVEREEKRVWLNECVERLENVLQTIETDLEKVGTKTKSKSKENVGQLENRVKKIKWHIYKLEEVILFYFLT